MKELEAVVGVTIDGLFVGHNWPTVTIEELVGQQNLRNGISIKTSDQQSPICCLRLSAMRGGHIDCSDSKPVPISDEQAGPFLVRAGDVFIVRGNGSLDLVGRAGLIEESRDDVIFPDLFIRVPLQNTTVLPRFFVKWWHSRHMRGEIENAAKTTSGIWKINQKHIASFSLPAPDLTVQHGIIAYLDDLQAKVDAVKRLQAKTQAELDALLPSMLDRAFRGEL